VKLSHACGGKMPVMQRQHSTCAHYVVASTGKCPHSCDKLRHVRAVNHVLQTHHLTHARSKHYTRAECAVTQLRTSSNTTDRHEKSVHAGNANTVLLRLEKPLKCAASKSVSTASRAKRPAPQHYVKWPSRAAPLKPEHPHQPNANTQS
jgi:hypothetical protein